MHNRFTRFTILFASLLAAGIFIPACGARPTERSGLSVKTQVNSPTLTPLLAITVTPGNTGKSTLIPPFSADQLKDMQYQLDIIAESLPESKGLVQLTGGVFEQLYPGSATGVRVELLNNTTGDLNGDGSEDAAAILAVNTGGSGTFIYLVAVDNYGGQPRQVASTPLGDRVQVKSIDIQDGVIRLGMVVHSDTDPLCCPSLDKQENYQLVGDRLVAR